MTETQPISLNKKLQGKVAIVTGGASGIGEATARLFAEHGALAVVIADIQPEKGRSTAESIGAQLCSYIQCDITDEDQVKAMVDWTVQTYGRLDVIFCNAGKISRTRQTILELDLPEFDGVMRVNARGTAVCVKHAARKMIELGSRGSIVCTASVVAAMGTPESTEYTMSKHAVLGLMRCASRQLGVHGIRVNCVSPSAVYTPMVREFGFTTIGDMEGFIGPFTSLKGVALTAEQVAEAVLFLACEESGCVTGHDLVVDGGLICYPHFN